MKPRTADWPPLEYDVWFGITVGASDKPGAIQRAARLAPARIATGNAKFRVGVARATLEAYQAAARNLLPASLVDKRSPLRCFVHAMATGHPISLILTWVQQGPQRGFATIARFGRRLEKHAWPLGKVRVSTGDTDARMTFYPRHASPADVRRILEEVQEACVSRW